MEGNFSDPLKSEPLLSLRAVSSASEMAAAIRNHERWRRRSWQRHAIFRAKKKPIDSPSHASNGRPRRRFRRAPRSQRDTVLRYIKALAQALHYLKTNREGSLAITPATRVSRIAR